MRRLGFLAFVIAFLACTGDDPPGDVSGGSAVPGSDAGDEGGMCATPARCSDDGRSIVTCAGTQPCPLGCDVSGARCKEIAPSGAAGTVQASTATAATVLEAANTYWFDTSTGTIGFRDESGTPAGPPVRAGGTGLVAGIGFEVVTQNDQSKVGVWSFRSLAVGKDAVLKAFGPDALTIVSLGDIVVDGQIRVGADCTKAAPGPGSAVAASARTGKLGVVKNTNPGFKFACSGGGGGGNGTAGGAGADTTENNTSGPNSVQSLGGAGGTKRDKTLIDDPLLVGGGNGGGGVTAFGGDASPALGGAGGGAIQLVASGALTINGLVDAAGCGGAKGYAGTQPINTAYCRGSGGGGGGGTIFLEANVVRVTATGRVLANGGGGGGGSTSYSSVAVNTDGASNADDGARARGGVADAVRGPCSPGQDGNVPDTGEPFANPCSGTDVAVGGSGGGGGFGSIAARTSDAAVVTADGGIVNPPFARSIAAVR